MRHSLILLAALPASLAYAQPEVPAEEPQPGPTPAQTMAPERATLRTPGAPIGQAVVAGRLDQTVDQSVDQSIDQSTNVTVQVDESAVPPPAGRPPAASAILLHGFRLGYMYTFDIEAPLGPNDSRNFIEAYGMRSPHSFVFGYEVAWRMIGHDWLNILAIANISIAGIEQSQVYPSGNLLVGFEAVAPGLGQVQLGIGASFSPTKEDPAHMILAAGVAPQVGSFFMPLHVFFIPDINGHHRIGVTLGTNFY
ncbi:MAG: hypothetical protein K8H88_23810 [Sandaracinaceae bacterium]|nr:hypothetical protein [Sandaracinaceae bacterium]